VVAYYTSSDWQLLGPSTQATYRGIIDRFRVEHGDKPVALLQAHHVRQILDAKAKTPAAANNLLKVLRVLMRYAVDRNLRRDDPTQGVKPLRYRTDGFHTWSEDEIAAFDKRWPTGTQERLAKDLLLHTAQRSGDVRMMGRQHVRKGVVSVRQQKTGTWLDIPVHASLEASIAARPSNHLTFLTTQHGEPYTSAGFGNWFRDAARKAGLPAGVSAHGLRKAAARRLAEAGCSAHQIQAVTGHKTLKEVERYTRAVAQKGLAEAAMSRVAGTHPEQILSNPVCRLDKSADKLGAK
jgi:integrase